MSQVQTLGSPLATLRQFSAVSVHSKSSMTGPATRVLDESSCSSSRDRGFKRTEILAPDVYQGRG
jgi:hypothetical protein